MEVSVFLSGTVAMMMTAKCGYETSNEDMREQALTVSDDGVESGSVVSGGMVMVLDRVRQRGSTQPVTRRVTHVTHVRILPIPPFRTNKRP